MCCATLLILLGILTLTIFEISTSHLRYVVKLGNVRIQSFEHSAQVITRALNVGLVWFGLRVIPVAARPYRNR
jgi:hypothetical protein